MSGFTETLSLINLSLNKSKCTAIGFNVPMASASWDNWSILGGCIGTPAPVQDHFDKKVLPKAVARIQCIAKNVAPIDPHVAFALLSKGCGFCQLNCFFSE